LKAGLASRSGGCHSSHTHKTALAHQTAFRCWRCGGDARGRRLGLRIRLRFHKYAPQQLAIGLALNQYAADELGGDDLGWAGEEELGDAVGERGDGPGVFGDSRLTIKRTS
jgi:hypothetical protein